MRSVEMIVVCNEVVDLLSAEIQNSNILNTFFNS